MEAHAHLRQVGESCGDRGMFRPESLLPGGDGLAIHRCRLVVAAFQAQELGQVIQACGHAGMILA